MTAGDPAPPPGSGPVTWRRLCASLAARLGSSAEARRIVERVSGLEGAGWYEGLDRPVAARHAASAEAMAGRRLAGEPLQYVVGRWGFRSLDLLVDRRALIPRPETEQVVEVALAEARRLGDGPLVAVDLGTGSGAIALSIAVELPNAQVWGTDASPDALAVARANLAGIGTLCAPRVRLCEGWWFDALPPDLEGRVGLLVCNPPYVAAAEQLPAEVADWEPKVALVAGPTGLEQVAAVLAGAGRWLARPAAVVVEIAPHQAEQARALAVGSGLTAAEVLPDLAGRPRALVARAG